MDNNDNIEVLLAQKMKRQRHGNEGEDLSDENRYNNNNMTNNNNNLN